MNAETLDPPPTLRRFAWLWPTTSTGKLTPEEIHIWSAAASGLSVGDREWDRCLSEDELERAKRFRFEADRCRYTRGRGLLRHLLGSYLNCAPAEIHFAYTPRGKPELRPTANPLGLIFSVSHVLDHLLLGFSLLRPIGVDLEAADRAGDWRELGGAVLSEREQTALAALPADQQTTGFLRAWTAKEAYLKATGQGLTDELAAVEAEVNPLLPARLLAAPGSPHALRGWTLVSFPVAEGVLGTVAWGPRTSGSIPDA